MSKETGGPAFPTVETGYNHDAGQREVSSHGGMTVRDYFAAKAMAVLSEQEKNATEAQIASLVYQIADAMLIERAK